MLRVWLLATVLISALSLVVFSPLAKIRQIEIIQSQNCLDSKTALQEAGVSKKLIFLVSEEMVAQELTKKHGCIGKLKVKKNLPSKLTLEVEIAQPLVKIENTNFSLTRQGWVFESLGGTQLPSLYLGTDISLQPGTRVNDETVVYALTIAEGLSKSDFSAVNLRIVDESSIAAYGQGGLVVIFSPKKDANFQLDSLQQVLALAKIDGTKITKIDLRFDKPVIVYK